MINLIPYLSSQITEQCPHGWRESNAITIQERESWRKSGCGEKNELCCTRRYEPSRCNKHCAMRLCEHAGGKWIPKDYMTNPYTCQLGL